MHRSAGFLFRIVLLSGVMSCFAACGGSNGTSVGSSLTSASSLAAVMPSVAVRAVVPEVSGVARPGFLGAFFRAVGTPPFGVFSPTLPQKVPSPYPTPGTTLFGSNGYCDKVAHNGVSITTGYPIDSTKLSNIEGLHVKWTRTTTSPLFEDESHVFPGVFSFVDIDAVQCTLLRNGISPVIQINAGPVQYNSTPGKLSPVQYTTYKTAADFGEYCGEMAHHERGLSNTTSRYSIPGNEVNTKSLIFPEGPTQIAAYAKACYASIKANQPNSFVYGFELNMDGQAQTPAFVRQMSALGCHEGTCYDGLAIHLSIVYPNLASGTPCYPNAGGRYDMQCVTDIRSAAGNSKLHILVSETIYPVPGSVPTETAKGSAIVAELKAMSLDPLIDGLGYANVDECARYPTGFFSNACLVNVEGTKLAGYYAVAALAASMGY